MSNAPEKQADHSIDTATGQEAPAELSSARVKKIFTDIAWKYERFDKRSSFGQYRSWLRTLIDKSPITKDTLMLDIAGGTGDVTFTACARKKPKSIILSDYTPAMLEVAQSRLDSGEANGVPVELAVVDGRTRAFGDVPRAEARRRTVRAGVFHPTQPAYALRVQPVLALGYSRMGQDRYRRCIGVCVPGQIHQGLPQPRRVFPHAERRGFFTRGIHQRHIRRCRRAHRVQGVAANQASAVANLEPKVRLAQQ